jgi:hypothetical protein
MSLSSKCTNWIAIGLGIALLAGCAGGSGTGAAPVASQPEGRMTIAQSTKGNVRFSILVRPKAKAARRTPSYISPSTQSMQILTDGFNPVIVNLTEFTACAPSPTVVGAIICTAVLSASAGSHVFTVTAYDLPDAKGHALSTNSTGAVIVKPTGKTTVALVLEGVVHAVVLALATTNPRIGQAASIGLTALLVDADENIIVGPAPYDYPVTLTTTDSADGPLSKTTLKSPADTSDIDVNYNGADVASITYSATATGLPAGNVTNAVLTPGARATPTPTPATHLYVTNDRPGFVSVFELADLAASPTIFTRTFS